MARKSKLAPAVDAAGLEVRLNAAFALVLDVAPSGVVPLRIGKLTFPLTREEAISMLFGEEPESGAGAGGANGASAHRPKRKQAKTKIGKRKKAIRKLGGSGGHADKRKRWQEFAIAYRAGESAKSIAGRYKCAQQTVYHGLSVLKVPLRGPLLKAKTKESVA
jgi:hypothetical protein